MIQKKHWAIYLRVSCQDQIKTGLDAQMRTMVEFCERQGVKDYEIFSDEGIAGAKESRPSLDRLMKAAHDGHISHVAVYSFSRFARSTTHLLRALETFQKLGIEFISLTEQIQTNSPMGRAFFTLTGESILKRFPEGKIPSSVSVGLRLHPFYCGPTVPALPIESS